MVTRTKKIFVGGLSAPTTLEDVKNYFEQFGPVSTTVILFAISEMCCLLRSIPKCKVPFPVFGMYIAGIS
jgi:RNA recognition motif-containing protein